MNDEKDLVFRGRLCDGDKLVLAPNVVVSSNSGYNYRIAMYREVEEHKWLVTSIAGQEVVVAEHANGAALKYLTGLEERIAEIPPGRFEGLQMKVYKLPAELTLYAYAKEHIKVWGAAPVSPLPKPSPPDHIVLEETPYEPE